MATRKAVKKSRSGPSGRNLTDEERKANGLRLVKSWLKADEVDWLDHEAERLETSRTGVLREMIRRRPKL